MSEWTPLTWWRENIMPKVTTIPTALLRGDSGIVQEGDMLPLGDARRVRLCSVVPDQEGKLTVQETFRVTPEVLGLHIREETVVLELTRPEAAAVLKLYESGNIEPAAADVLNAMQANTTGAAQ
jgi:hypothetical protein